MGNNSTLEFLNISSNNLGTNGGKSLQEGIERNLTLKKVDLRLSGIGPDSEEVISNRLEQNSG